MIRSVKPVRTCLCALTVLVTAVASAYSLDGDSPVQPDEPSIIAASQWRVDEVSDPIAAKAKWDLYERRLPRMASPDPVPSQTYYESIDFYDGQNAVVQPFASGVPELGAKLLALEFLRNRRSLPNYASCNTGVWYQSCYFGVSPWKKKAAVIDPPLLADLNRSRAWALTFLGLANPTLLGQAEHCWVQDSQYGFFGWEGNVAGEMTARTTVRWNFNSLERVSMCDMNPTIDSSLFDEFDVSESTSEEQAAVVLVAMAELVGTFTSSADVLAELLQVTADALTLGEWGHWQESFSSLDRLGVFLGDTREEDAQFVVMPLEQNGTVNFEVAALSNTRMRVHSTVCGDTPLHLGKVPEEFIDALDLGQAGWSAWDFLLLQVGYLNYFYLFFANFESPHRAQAYVSAQSFQGNIVNLTATAL